MAVKKRAQLDIKLFLSCPVLQVFSIFIQIFCPGLNILIFGLNWKFCVFWPNLPRRMCFLPKTEEINSSIELSIFEVVFLPSFSVNWYFWFFGPNFSKTDVFGIKHNNLWTTPHWILNIWISLANKFQLKLKILIFDTKFVQRGFFPSNTKKVNSAMEFCIFELVYVLNLSLNWYFLIFWTKFAKKTFFPFKTDKVKSAIDLCISQLVYVPNFNLNLQL